MNSTHIMHAANPIDDTAFADSWTDPKGTAAFERIVAEPRVPPTPTRATAHRPIRRRLALGVGLAAAAGAAVAVAGLPGPNHGGASAAWSVTANPDGSVTVSINDYRDPERLQASLRAAHLQAIVTSLPPTCWVSGFLVGTTRTGNGPTHRIAGILFTGDYGWLWSRSRTRYELPRGTAIGVKMGRVGSVQFTARPNAQPAGTTMTVAFPAAKSPSAGANLLVATEPSRTPLACPPQH